MKIERIIIYIIAMFSCIPIYAQQEPTSPEQVFLGRDSNACLVEATCSAFRKSPDKYVEVEFTVSRVYVGGNSARLGEIFYITGDEKGPSIRDELIWPIPAKGDRGLWLVENREGSLRHIKSLQFPWPVFLMEQSVRFRQYEELAREIEIYSALREDGRIGRLREDIASVNGEIERWAIFCMSHVYPDQFCRVVDTSLRSGIPSAEQWVYYDIEMARLRGNGWIASALRLSSLLDIVKCNPSKLGASALASRLDMLTQSVLSGQMESLLRACAVFVGNKQIALADRLRVVRAVGLLAAKSKSIEAIRTVRSILSSSDVPQLKAEARAWLEKCP